jgi:hypothetical protein
VAHLTRTEETNKTSEHKVGVVEGTFRLIEVLKGNHPPVEKYEARSIRLRTARYRFFPE